MIRRDEKGFTLVESLAVLVIGSIVMIFAFILIANGMKNSNNIKEQASLQNEANYMLVVLREFQERGNPYKIIVNADELIIEEIEAGHHRTLFNKFDYDIISSVGYEISPKEKNHKTISITITIYSKKYPHITHTTQTKLQRL